MRRGFTLLELLVVISLIGLFAMIVLAGITNARDKGDNAKVKEQLSTLRRTAEIYYDNTGSYGATVNGTEGAGSSIGKGCNSGMFASATLSTMTDAANYPRAALGTGKCTTNGSSFAVSIALNTAGTFWCIDSNGSARLTNALQNDSTYQCP